MLIAGALAGFVMVGVWVLGAMHLFPYIFNLVFSLFESHDVGVIVGLLACLLVAGPYVLIAGAVTAFAIGLVYEITK